MIRLADLDPIVITNISHFRCDAFLIDHNGIGVLELPNLKRIEIHEQVEKLQTLRATYGYNIAPMLEWLWEALARSEGTIESNVRYCSLLVSIELVPIPLQVFKINAKLKVEAQS